MPKGTLVTLVCYVCTACKSEFTGPRKVCAACKEEGTVVPIRTKPSPPQTNTPRTWQDALPIENAKTVRQTAVLLRIQLERMAAYLEEAHADQVEARLDRGERERESDRCPYCHAMREAKRLIAYTRDNKLP